MTVSGYLAQPMVRHHVKGDIQLLFSNYLYQNDAITITLKVLSIKMKGEKYINIPSVCPQSSMGILPVSRKKCVR